MTGGANPYAVIIEEVFGLDKIEFLQSHENIDIYKKAFDIIERYFGNEEEDKQVRLGFSSYQHLVIIISICLIILHYPGQLIILNSIHLTILNLPFAGKYSDSYIARNLHLSI